MKGIILVVTVGFSVVALYASTLSTTALATADQSDPTNHPAVFPNTGQPTPMNGTNRVSQTGGNPNLPPAYQGGPSNLHDTLGTNAANRGNDQPTLTNHPNPNLQLP
jgi:hypothetical protein